MENLFANIITNLSNKANKLPTFLFFFLCYAALFQEQARGVISFFSSSLNLFLSEKTQNTILTIFTKDTSLTTLQFLLIFFLLYILWELLEKIVLGSNNKQWGPISNFLFILSTSSLLMIAIQNKLLNSPINVSTLLNVDSLKHNFSITALLYTALLAVSLLILFLLFIGIYLSPLIYFIASIWSLKLGVFLKLVLIGIYLLFLQRIATGLL